MSGVQKHVWASLLQGIMFTIFGFAAIFTLEDAKYKLWLAIPSLTLSGIFFFGTLGYYYFNLPSRYLWTVVVTLTTFNIVVAVVITFSAILANIFCAQFCREDLAYMGVFYLVCSVGALVLSCVMFCQSKFKFRRLKREATLRRLYSGDASVSENMIMELGKYSDGGTPTSPDSVMVMVSSSES